MKRITIILKPTAECNFRCSLNGEVNNYYEIAPKICDAIDAKGEAAAKIEYEWIWNTYLSKAYDALNNNEPKNAHEIYKDMVLRLQEIYL